jgi:hypothetical protein
MTGKTWQESHDRKKSLSGEPRQESHDRKAMIGTLWRDSYEWKLMSIQFRHAIHDSTPVKRKPWQENPVTGKPWQDSQDRQAVTVQSARYVQWQIFFKSIL